VQHAARLVNHESQRYIDQDEVRRIQRSDAGQYAWVLDGISTPPCVRDGLGTREVTASEFTALCRLVLQAGRAFAPTQLTGGTSDESSLKRIDVARRKLEPPRPGVRYRTAGNGYAVVTVNIDGMRHYKFEPAGELRYCVLIPVSPTLEEGAPSLDVGQTGESPPAAADSPNDSTRRPRGVNGVPEALTAQQHPGLGSQTDLHFTVRRVTPLRDQPVVLVLVHMLNRGQLPIIVERFTLSLPSGRTVDAHPVAVREFSAWAERSLPGAMLRLNPLEPVVGTLVFLEQLRAGEAKDVTVSPHVLPKG
jgi:hypothetical protein